MWDYLEPVSALVDDLVTVHRYDQRGCGGSSGHGGPHTVSQPVADLDAVRAAVGVDRWTVGGHSWGATLALHYALAHPERVTGLLYLSGTGLGRSWHAAYQAEADRRLTDDQRRRRDELGARDRTWAEEVEWRTLMWSRDHADPEAALDCTAALAATPLPINHQANAELGREVAGWDEVELAARCTTLDLPALLIHGARDPRPAWAIDSLAESLPRATTVILDDAGHLPWLEERDRVADAARTFLKPGGDRTGVPQRVILLV